MVSPLWVRSPPVASYLPLAFLLGPLPALAPVDSALVPLLAPPAPVAGPCAPLRVRLPASGAGDGRLAGGPGTGSAGAAALRGGRVAAPVPEGR